MQIKHLHREYKIRGKQSLIESHLCSVLQNHTSLCTNCFPIVPIWKHQNHISNVLLSPFVHFLLSFSGCVLAALPLCCLKSTCGGFPAGLVRSLWIISAALGLFLTLPAPHPHTPHTQTHSFLWPITDSGYFEQFQLQLHINEALMFQHENPNPVKHQWKLRWTEQQPLTFHTSFIISCSGLSAANNSQLKPKIRDKLPSH